MSFTKCPKCGNEYFTEQTLSYTYQKGIRITKDGEPDYDDADGLEISDVEELIGYFCTRCDSKLNVE